MKKDDLKKLIKPLVKECIHEVLLEEGLLSSVVAEGAKGLQGGLITERAPSRPAAAAPPRQRQASKNRAKLKEHRQKLMDSINSDAYNGVDLFEGSTPMASQQSATPAGTTDLGNPADSGVDISSLLGDSSKIWRAIK